jgi:SAM-dependent MidA family methyltransferase
VTRDWLPWRAATERALYGAPTGGSPAGFFRRERPADHFRTSAHVGGCYAGAVGRLAQAAGAQHVVDVGAGDGWLLRHLTESSAGLALTAVELAPRPAGLPGAVRWTADLSGALAAGPPGPVLVHANEWLDDVPVDVVQVAPDGTPRLVLVDPATGDERLGAPVTTGPDAAWLARWWPLAGAAPGTRAEVGRPRDVAWAAVVAALAGRRHGGVALAVDYAHAGRRRPAQGSLTGYRHGRQVRPVPDGSCDVTSHVAIDAAAEAGVAAGATSSLLTTQRQALSALGVDATLPDVALARLDPHRYGAALVAANRAAELLDPGGLGGFAWLLQGVGIDVAPLLGREAGASGRRHARGSGRGP